MAKELYAKVSVAVPTEEGQPPKNLVALSLMDCDGKDYVYTTRKQLNGMQEELDRRVAYWNIKHPEQLADPETYILRLPIDYKQRNTES